MSSVAYNGALPIQEVVEQLSVREFIKLCDLVDEAFGKTVTEVSNASGTTPKYASRKAVVKFNVRRIERVGKKLNVHVDVDGGRLANVTVCDE